MKGKKQGKGKKVVTIVKARGVPDKVKVERSAGAEPEQPEVKAMRRELRTQPRLPRGIFRISPKTPRLR